MTTILAVRDLRGGAAVAGFTFQITLWLWFTVLFANFAEAMDHDRITAVGSSVLRLKLGREQIMSGNGLGIHAQAQRRVYAVDSTVRTELGGVVVSIPTLGGRIGGGVDPQRYCAVMLLSVIWWPLSVLVMTTFCICTTRLVGPLIRLACRAMYRSIDVQTSDRPQSKHEWTVGVGGGSGHREDKIRTAGGRECVGCCRYP